MKQIRIGSGAGFGGDRIEPAIDLIKYGELDYICFECLAERTVSLAVAQLQANPHEGYSEQLEHRFHRIIPAMLDNHVKVITNMGAANPVTAAQKVASLAKSLGGDSLKIASVSGDDVLDRIHKLNTLTVLETGKPLADFHKEIVSANAYTGIQGIVKALEEGADIVIVGRVADPSLFLAPLVYEFGWPMDDYDVLAQGTMVGHLLECGAHVTGGYFTDPGYKDVPDLWNVGFPIAEVSENGEFIITKLENSGGIVTEATVKEQVLYEIHNPAAYMTPDVIVDISNIQVKQSGENRVFVTGIKGHEKNGYLKTLIGYYDGWMGESGISYGGLGAVERAKLAIDIIKKRYQMLNLNFDDIRFDIIGYNSLYAEYSEKRAYPSATDVRVRVAVRASDKSTVERALNEVEALYTNGPYGGGGVTKLFKQVLSILSVFIPEGEVRDRVLIIK